MKYLANSSTALVVEFERGHLEDVDGEVADVLRHDLQPAGLVVALELGLHAEVALHVEDLVRDDLALVAVLLALVLDVVLPEDVPELLHVVRALLDAEHLFGAAAHREVHLAVVVLVDEVPGAEIGEEILEDEPRHVAHRRSL